MKIAYLIHSLHAKGGKERVLTLKANYLAEELGYDVSIITAHMKGRPFGFALSPKVRHIDLDANEGLSARFGRYRRHLETCLQSLRPDITISLGGSDISVLPLLKDGSVKIGEFHFSHDKFKLKYGTHPLGKLYAILRTRSVERAAAKLNAFVVLTKEDQATWQKFLPHVYQIYNPLTFKPSKRADLKGKRCIAAGRLTEQKNFTDSVLAWKTVSGKHPDWTLDIFGTGPEHDKLLACIKSLNLEDKVHLRGRSDNMQNELLTSDFLLMSSKYEGFPMILLEASACGLPMVSYDCPCGPSALVKDGINGYLVPNGDVEALADACSRMIEGPRAEFGKASFEMAGQYTIEAIMGQWDKLFRSLL